MLTLGNTNNMIHAFPTGTWTHAPRKGYLEMAQGLKGMVPDNLSSIPEFYCGEREPESSELHECA